MSTDKKFACAINCMDGRVQDAVKKYMQDNYGVDYVDMVTEPGPNKILADNSDKAIIENIKKRVEVSTHHHGSKVDCNCWAFWLRGKSDRKRRTNYSLKKS